ncbi:hypothetical protein C8F04DRAFT_1260061 [Mycena alexandri]|uniref:Uncharacterized protein n=1 Tax=Mycena alexandri TaxID=1745969 RepID=A0AAD6X493_9AGAR|nr:hypothetical protein C8F04DRAFT_1260061 [Mycena alexandri]
MACGEGIPASSMVVVVRWLGCWARAQGARGAEREPRHGCTAAGGRESSLPSVSPSTSSVLLLRRRRRWRLKGREGRGRAPGTARARAQAVEESGGEAQGQGQEVDVLLLAADKGDDQEDAIFHRRARPSHTYTPTPVVDALRGLLTQLNTPSSSSSALSSSSSSALRPVALVEALCTPLVCAPTTSELDAYSTSTKSMHTATNATSTSSSAKNLKDISSSASPRSRVTPASPPSHHQHQQPHAAPAAARKRPRSSPDTSTRMRGGGVCAGGGGRVGAGDCVGFHPYSVVVPTARAFLVDCVSDSGGGVESARGGALVGELVGEWEWEASRSLSSGSALEGDWGGGRAEGGAHRARCGVLLRGRVYPPPDTRAAHQALGAHEAAHGEERRAGRGSGAARLDSGLYTTGGVLNLDPTAGMGNEGCVHLRRLASAGAQREDIVSADAGPS